MRLAEWNEYWHQRGLQGLMRGMVALHLPQSCRDGVCRESVEQEVESAFGEALWRGEATYPKALLGRIAYRRTASHLRVCSRGGYREVYAAVDPGAAPNGSSELYVERLLERVSDELEALYDDDRRAFSVLLRHLLRVCLDPHAALNRMRAFTPTERAFLQDFEALLRRLMQELDLTGHTPGTPREISDELGVHLATAYYILKAAKVRVGRSVRSR